MSVIQINIFICELCDYVEQTFSNDHGLWDDPVIVLPKDSNFSNNVDELFVGDHPGHEKMVCMSCFKNYKKDNA